LAISADGREGRCGARSGCRKDSRSFYEHLDDLLLRELALMRVVQKGSNVSGQLARGQRVSGDAQRAANQLLRAGALVSQPLGLAVDAHATEPDRQRQKNREKEKANISERTIGLRYQRTAALAASLLQMTDPGCRGSSQPRGHDSEALQGGTSGGSRSMAAAAAPAAALADEEDDVAARAAAAADDDAAADAAGPASPSSTVESIDEADLIAG